MFNDAICDVDDNDDGMRWENFAVPRIFHTFAPQIRIIFVEANAPNKNYNRKLWLNCAARIAIENIRRGSRCETYLSLEQMLMYCVK